MPVSEPCPTVLAADSLGLAPWQFKVEGIECANGFNGHAYQSADRPAATVQASRPVKVKIGTYGGTRSINEPSPTVLTHGRRRTRSELTLAVEPESDMRRFSVGRELDKLGQGETSERYFQLVRASLAAPSPTITAEGRKAHAASVAHPTECRKFSIAELRRICAFPDDFVLLGTYAEQWERLGRAVPPVMMAAIAETIRDRVLDPATRSKGADCSAPLGRVAA